MNFEDELEKLIKQFTKYKATTDKLQDSCDALVIIIEDLQEENKILKEKLNDK